MEPKAISDLKELIQFMRDAREFLNDIPEDHEFTTEEVDTIDDIRLASSALTDMADGVIENINGTG